MRSSASFNVLAISSLLLPACVPSESPPLAPIPSSTAKPEASPTSKPWLEIGCQGEPVFYGDLEFTVLREVENTYVPPVTAFRYYGKEVYVVGVHVSQEAVDGVSDLMNQYYVDLQAFVEASGTSSEKSEQIIEYLQNKERLMSVVLVGKGYQLKNNYYGVYIPSTIPEEDYKRLTQRDPWSPVTAGDLVADATSLVDGNISGIIGWSVRYGDIFPLYEKRQFGGIFVSLANAEVLFTQGYGAEYPDIGSPAYESLVTYAVLFNEIIGIEWWEFKSQFPEEFDRLLQHYLDHSGFSARCSPAVIATNAAVDDTFDLAILTEALSTIFSEELIRMHYGGGSFP